MSHPSAAAEVIYTADSLRDHTATEPSAFQHVVSSHQQNLLSSYNNNGLQEQQHFSFQPAHHDGVVFTPQQTATTTTFVVVDGSSSPSIMNSSTTISYQPIYSSSASSSSSMRHYSTCLLSSPSNNQPPQNNQQHFQQQQESSSSLCFVDSPTTIMGHNCIPTILSNYHHDGSPDSAISDASTVRCVDPNYFIQTLTPPDDDPSTNNLMMNGNRNSSGNYCHQLVFETRQNAVFNSESPYRPIFDDTTTIGSRYVPNYDAVRSETHQQATVADVAPNSYFQVGFYLF
jgi:hypothetical protein